MKKLFMSLIVVMAVVGGVMACKGGKSPSGPSDNTGGFSSTPTVAGQPSDLDLARLASRFGTIAAQALQQTLSASSGTSSLSGLPGELRTLDSISGMRALGAPSSASTVGAFFLCCSDTAATNLVVGGSIGAATPGTVPVSLSYSTSAPLQWTGVNSGASWNLTFQTGTLTLTGTLTTASGAIGPNQQLTLAGALQYSVPGNANPFTLPVALTFTYPDLSAPATQDSGAGTPPTTSGSLGTLLLTGTSLPSVSMTGRCSAPQEACGALVSGSCPCTKWPPCPSYGLSCPGTFK